MTHLSLFSGIGGLDLAAEWAGFKTVGQCEWADYPTKVLEKHWPDVPRWRDIRTLTGESFYERTGLRTVDVISGGFPCQPFSVAGKQKGKEDDRYLWPEMLRVIREIAPRWVIGENVPGILRIAAADVVQDLEREGYDVVVFDFEAAAVGAPHRRERVAFVANRVCHGCSDGEAEKLPAKAGEYAQRYPAGCGKDVANAESIGFQRHRPGREQVVRIRLQKRQPAGGCDVCDTAGEGFQNRADKPVGRHGTSEPELERPDRRSIEPGLGGMADGFPRWLDEPDGVPRVTKLKTHRADRLKCLGNAVVPQQFYPIFKAIAEVTQNDRDAEDSRKIAGAE